jgi:hypothetical protein
MTKKTWEIQLTCYWCERTGVKIIKARDHRIVKVVCTGCDRIVNTCMVHDSGDYSNRMHIHVYEK